MRTLWLVVQPDGRFDGALGWLEIEIDWAGVCVSATEWWVGGTVGLVGVGWASRPQPRLNPGHL